MGESVLILDDNLPLLRGLQRALSRHGKRDIYATSDPDEAICYALAERPECAVVDVFLGPGRPTGFDVVAQLRRKQDRIRAVMMSGAWSESYRDLALGFGAIELLEKPFLFPQLTRLLFGAAECHVEDTLIGAKVKHIRRVLEVCQGNRSEAARWLGIRRTTLQKMLRSLNDDAAL